MSGKAGYQDSYGERCTALWKRIAETPFIGITYRYGDRPEQEVLVKCEQYSVSGSIKDRVALYILQKAFEQGKLRPADLIVEAGADNSGIAYAAIGRSLGHRVRLIVPGNIPRKYAELIRGYSADMTVIPGIEGGLDACIRKAEFLGSAEGVFLPRQFNASCQAEVHEKTTGREIGHQLLLHGVKPAAFTAGMGTGGTLLGVSRYLRMLYPGMDVFPVIPVSSRLMNKGGEEGLHRIAGVVDAGCPAMTMDGPLSPAIRVQDGDAILMAQQFGNKLRLGVGISSGANLVAAIRLQQQLGRDAAVITVFPDSNQKYTSLFEPEPERADFISPDVRLTGYRVL